MNLLYWALICLVIALVAGMLGFGLVGGVAYTVAKVLFFVFLVLFLVTLVMSLMRRAT